MSLREQRAEAAARKRHPAGSKLEEIMGTAFKSWYYTVRVDAEDAAHADQVIQERILHDEPYTDERGVEFEYRIDTLDGMSEETQRLNATSDLVEAARNLVGYIDGGTLKLEWADDPQAGSGPANVDGLRAAIAKAEGRLTEDERAILDPDRNAFVQQARKDRGR